MEYSYLSDCGRNSERGAGEKGKMGRKRRRGGKGDEEEITGKEEKTGRRGRRDGRGDEGIVNGKEGEMGREGKQKEKAKKKNSF